MDKTKAGKHARDLSKALGEAIYNANELRRMLEPEGFTPVYLEQLEEVENTCQELDHKTYDSAAYAGLVAKL